jgi:hypothetical protein
VLAPQSVHGEPNREYLPARQFTQSATASDLGGDDFPAAQFKHVAAEVARVVAEYLPAAQSTHGEPDREYWPSEQSTQSDSESDPSNDDFPALQFEHVRGEGEPNDVEYLPAAQFTHAEPNREYWPLKQSTQLPIEKDPSSDDFPATQFKHGLAVVAADVVEYLPAAQLTHDEFPLLYVPAGHTNKQSAKSSDPDADDVPSGQFKQFEPASEYWFARQFTQSVKTSDPGGDDFPAAQFKHVAGVVARVVAEYLPAAQSTHVEPASEYWPLAQSTHFVKPPDPDGDDFPAEQSKHVAGVVASTVVEYLPAAQLTHDKSGRRYLPWRQIPQSAKASDPDNDVFPAAQSRHVAAVVAATVAEYLPAAQFAHVAAVVADEYLPAVQSMHGLSAP